MRYQMERAKLDKAQVFPTRKCLRPHICLLECRVVVHILKQPQTVLLLLAKFQTRLSTRDTGSQGKVSLGCPYNAESH